MKHKTPVKIIEPNELMSTSVRNFISEIQELFPARIVEHVGAMAVPMSGREEIDIVVISPDVQGDSNLMNNTKYSTGPTIDGISYFKQSIDDIEVGVQIIPEGHHMIDVHRGVIEKLRNNHELREKYSKFKHSLHGLDQDEYKEKKGEWIRENLI